MPILGMVSLAMGLVTGNGAGKPTVLACLNPGANATVVVRAQGYANRLFDEMGVRLRWEGDVRRCAGGIVITLAENTPASTHSGDLAYAWPYERPRAVVFFDRVRAAVPPGGVPALLAHVLAHEIVHILQGVARHSESGLMKKRWDYADYVEMQRRSLRIAPDDLLLIERGLNLRSAAK
jgi:hypothetical protein